MIRGEALYSGRSAWFVCFPGTSARDRLTNFKGPGRDVDEIALARRTLTLFAALAGLGVNDKAQLMTAGATARAVLRQNAMVEDEKLISAALAAVGVGDKKVLDEVELCSRDEPTLLQDCPGGREVPNSTNEEPVAVIMPGASVSAEQSEAQIDVEPKPPMPPSPHEPPIPPPQQPPPVTAPRPDPALAGQHVALAMRKYAAQISKTGRLVGIFPFLVWSILRRLRVQVLCGRGRIDPVTEFAPWAMDLLREPATPLIVIWSRVFRCWVNGAESIVVRALDEEAALSAGNHWVAGLYTRGVDRACAAYQHPPCNGRLCAGGASRHCLGPVRAAAAALNITVVPTVAQGDCAFDAMAFWAGGARDLGTWKRLRQELAQAVMDHATDANWQAAFQSCGEYDPPKAEDAAGENLAVAKPVASRAAVTSALAVVSQDSRPVPKDVVDAVCWAMGLAVRERHIAESLASHMTDLEQEAVLKWQGDDSVSAASALAGAKGGLPNRRRLDVALRLKRAWGRVLCTWCKANDIPLRMRLPWGTMARFWQEHGGTRDSIPGRLLLRYARKVQQGEVMARCGTMDVMSRRRREGAGRPNKAPALRESLFEWFCMVRGAVKARLPLAALAAQARTMRHRYMKRALDLEIRVDVPQITPKWLRRFRQEYGISLRSCCHQRPHRHRHHHHHHHSTSTTTGTRTVAGRCPGLYSKSVFGSPG